MQECNTFFFFYIHKKNELKLWKLSYFFMDLHVLSLAEHDLVIFINVCLYVMYMSICNVCLYVCMWHKYFGCSVSSTNARNVIKLHVLLKFDIIRCWLVLGVFRTTHGVFMLYCPDVRNCYNGISMAWNFIVIFS